MQVGYNTNIPYKGKVYHVQTEDTGIESYHIISLLYFKGAILVSRKVSYAHLKGLPDFKEKVREFMKEQHKSLIKELINGDFANDISEESDLRDKGETKEQEMKSLDDILIDYILKQATKQ